MRQQPDPGAGAGALHGRFERGGHALQVLDAQAAALSGRNSSMPRPSSRLLPLSSRHRTGADSSWANSWMCGCPARPGSCEPSTLPAARRTRRREEVSELAGRAACGEVNAWCRSCCRYVAAGQIRPFFPQRRPCPITRARWSRARSCNGHGGWVRAGKVPTARRRSPGRGGRGMRR